MEENRIFSKIEELHRGGIGSCSVLHIRPGARIPKHFHKRGIEIEYVYRGNCRTHKQGRIYVWKKNKVHEVVNDSNEELVLICLKIPPHSEEDMCYVHR